jgi:hypothetical protein
MGELEPCRKWQPWHIGAVAEEADDLQNELHCRLDPVTLLIVDARLSTLICSATCFWRTSPLKSRLTLKSGV